LQRAANQLGIKVIPAYLRDKDGEAVPHPFIAHTQQKDNHTGSVREHYVVVLRMTDAHVYLLDSPLAPYRVSRKEFAGRWSGYVLFLPRNDSDDAAVRSVLRVGKHNVVLGIVTCLIYFGILLALFWVGGAPASIDTLARQLNVSIRRNDHRVLGATVMCVVVLAIVGILKKSSVDMTGPRLVIEPVVNLGVLSSGLSRQQIQVRNAGTTTLYLRSIASSCSCARVVLPREYLTPGESCAITVDLSIGSGPGSAQLSIESSDPTGPHRCGITWYGSGFDVMASPTRVEAFVDEGEVFSSVVDLVVPEGLHADLHVFKFEAGNEGFVQMRVGVPRTEVLYSPGHPAHGVLRVQPIEIDVTGPADVMTVCRIQVEYAQERHLVEIPVSVKFRRRNHIEPSGILFSGGSLESCVGQTRSAVVIHRDLSSSFDVAHCPEWLGCVVYSLTPGESVVELNVCQQPPAAVVRETVELRHRESGEKYRLDVMVFGTSARPTS
jgi:hypothetical protein